MTCIVGISKGNTVFLGGDSAATAGDGSQTIIGEPKVFVKGKVAFGVCGSPLVMDWIRHSFELPEHPVGMASRTYMTTLFAPGLKECLAEAEMVDEKGCVEADLLLGYDGTLYNLESNFQLIVSRSCYNSVGSGYEPALGSLHGSSGDPKKRLLAALKASTDHNATVRPPYVIVSVKGR